MRDIVLIGLAAAVFILAMIAIASWHRGGFRFRVRGRDRPTPDRQGIADPNRPESRLAVVPFFALLGDGGWIVIVAVLLVIAGLAYGLFGRTSRQRINEHPIGDRRGEGVAAPGAEGASDPAGSDRDAIRGTRHGTR